MEFALFVEILAGRIFVWIVNVRAQQVLLYWFQIGSV
jgi:hypothetical protein